MIKSWWAICGLLALPLPADAQVECDAGEKQGSGSSPETSRGLSASTILRIGVRDDAWPFSFALEDPTAQIRYDGYTVRLCTEFATREGLEYCVYEVTPENRFELLGREIDMLCGATTITLNVRHAFRTSLYTFLTATTYIEADSAANAETLEVGVLRGTTAQNVESPGVRTAVQKSATGAAG